MNVGHIFSGLLNDLKKTVHAVKGKANLAGVEAIANQVQKYLPQALTVVKMIDLMAPNTSAGHAAEDIEKVAEKYQLHVTPEILADPIQSATLLQNAALKELQHLTGPSVASSVLNSAITLAVNFMRATN